MIFYRLIYFLFKYPIRMLLVFQVEGEENIPETGGFIISGNHTHWFDPVTVALSSKRKYRSMAKAELFDTPLKSFLMRNLGAFPIRRGKGDRSALKNAVEILERGEPMIMFPEGTRSRTGELQPFKAGIALLSRRSGCPIIPVAIKYEGGKPLVFRKTKVIIGKPMAPSELGMKEDNHEEYLRGAAAVRERVRLLLESDGEKQ